MLRIGSDYGDDRRASNLSEYPWDDEPSPTKPVLTSGRGGGSGADWRQDYWLWPLPEAARVAFVCEWPAEDIAETRVELDGAALWEAADRALELWPAPKSR